MTIKIPLGTVCKMLENHNKLLYAVKCSFSSVHPVKNISCSPLFSCVLMGICSCYRVVVLQVPVLCSSSSGLSQNSFPCLGTREVVFRNGRMLQLERRDNEGRRNRR